MEDHSSVQVQEMVSVTFYVPDGNFEPGVGYAQSKHQLLTLLHTR